VNNRLDLTHAQYERIISIMAYTCTGKPYRRMTDDEKQHWKTRMTMAWLYEERK
jgi:hypothetical protein